MSAPRDRQGVARHSRRRGAVGFVRSQLLGHGPRRANAQIQRRRRRRRVVVLVVVIVVVIVVSIVVVIFFFLEFHFVADLLPCGGGGGMFGTIMIVVVIVVIFVSILSCIVDVLPVSLCDNVTGVRNNNSAWETWNGILVSASFSRDSVFYSLLFFQSYFCACSLSLFILSFHGIVAKCFAITHCIYGPKILLTISSQAD